MKPRDYQSDAVDFMLGEFQNGKRAGLIVMPTGMGKTYTVGLIMKALMGMRGRGMFCAHKYELLAQAQDMFEGPLNLLCDLDMGADYGDKGPGGLMQYRTPIMLTSMQTGSRQYRMERMDPAKFATLSIDEAHMAVTNSYRRMMEHYQSNPDLKIIGMTATPNRTDEKALGEVFDTFWNGMGLIDAIKLGWLVNIKAKSVRIDSIDLSSVKKKGCDLDPIALASAMEDSRALMGIARSIYEYVGNRKTLVFTASVPQAHAIANILDGWARGKVCCVDGKTDKDARKSMTAAFRSGEIQFFVNHGIATHGFDVPDIEVVANARPTLSTPLVCQMMGRGTRPLSGLVDGIGTAAERVSAIARSDKPDMVFLDYVGAMGKHKLITPFDVLGGKCSDEVMGIVAGRYRKDEQEVSVADAIELATKEERDNTLAMQHARENAERLLHQGVNVKVRFTTKSVDPFDVFDIAPARVPGWTLFRKMTDSQSVTIKRFGVKNVDGYSIEQAGQLIDVLVARDENQLCSLKIARIIKRYGYRVDTVSKKAGGRIMGAIVSQNWPSTRDFKRPALPKEVSNWFD